MKFSFIITLILFSLVSFAQDEEESKLSYTYASDKQFNKASNLTGYTFVPNEVEEGEYGIEFIDEGDVAILFFDNRILFKGVEGYKSLNILSKNPFQLGYEVDWMDAKDPAISGKLRVIVDEENFAQVIYINSKTTPEYAFFLPLKSSQLLEAEEAYFTSKRSIEARSYPRLIGKTIRPYRIIEDVRKGGTEQRISMKDSIYLSFKENQVYFKKGALDKTYNIKKAKTFEYTQPGRPEIKFLMEIAVSEVGEKFKIFLNSRNQIERIFIRGFSFTLMP